MTTTAAPPGETIRVSDAARLLGTSRQIVSAVVNAGAFPVYRSATDRRERRVVLDDVRAALVARLGDAAPATIPPATDAPARAVAVYCRAASTKQDGHDPLAKQEGRCRTE